MVVLELQRLVRDLVVAEVLLLVLELLPVLQVQEQVPLLQPELEVVELVVVQQHLEGSGWGRTCIPLFSYVVRQPWLHAGTSDTPRTISPRES